MSAAYNKFKIELRGVQNAIANAKEFERRLKRGSMRMALAKATSPMLAKAKSLAPRQSGLLKKSLKKKTVTNTKTDSVTIIIGADKSVSGKYKNQERRPARYLHLVELGHAGAAPQPFLRPAYESTKGDVQATFQKEMSAAIPKVAARLNKRPTR